VGENVIQSNMGVNGTPELANNRNMPDEMDECARSINSGNTGSTPVTSTTLIGMNSQELSHWRNWIKTYSAMMKVGYKLLVRVQHATTKILGN